MLSGCDGNFFGGAINVLELDRGWLHNLGKVLNAPE
jgi:hypothetical protein